MVRPPFMNVDDKIDENEYLAVEPKIEDEDANDVMIEPLDEPQSWQDLVESNNPLLDILLQIM